jgi:hypothetical protein
LKNVHNIIFNLHKRFQILSLKSVQHLKAASTVTLTFVTLIANFHILTKQIRCPLLAQKQTCKP